MKAFLYRWGNHLVLILVLSAVIWSTLALGAVLTSGFAITFGLLAGAFALWLGLRILGGDEIVEIVRAPARSRSRTRQVERVTTAWSDSEEESEGEEESEKSNTSHVRFVPALKVQSRLGALLLVLLTLYLIVQVVPLPVGLVSMLSPRRVALDEMFRAPFQEPAPKSLTLALDPEATRRALPIYAAALMAFTIGAYLGTKRRLARQAVMVLLILGVAEALYGLFANLTGQSAILSIQLEGSMARGTFVNRNHFAATLALLLPVMLGWFFCRAAEAKSRFDESHLLPATSIDVLGSRQALWLLPPAILVVAIIQSQSRGGFASMILGIGLMFAIGARSKPVRTFFWLSIPLAVLLLVSGFTSDYEGVLTRFNEYQQNYQNEGRTQMWSDSLGIVRDYPLFGVGLGNFPRAYMQYSSASTIEYAYQAHNEWLETLVTLGLAGAILIALLAFGFFLKSFRRIKRTGADQPWLLGAWCGLLGLILHSFAEFNFHIPSIVVTAALLAGLTLGFTTHVHSRKKRRKQGKKESARTGGWPTDRRRTRMIRTHPLSASTAERSERTESEIEDSPLDTPVETAVEDEDAFDPDDEGGVPRKILNGPIENR